MNFIMLIVLMLVYQLYTVYCLERQFNVNADVAFRLYTRKHGYHHELLEINNTKTLLNSSLMFDKPLKIFCHGYTIEPEALLVVKTFLGWSDVNVITIDWTKGSLGTEYEAVVNVSLIGQLVADFIDWLSTHGIPFNNIHLVGVSMGCHLVGLIGRNCKNGKIPYITACDPSRRFWENNPNAILANDAKYVEVIHTNIGINGIKTLAGTTDFYPNGGINMPGCMHSKTFNETVCSHAHSLFYFLDSIDNRRFKAMKCANFDEIIHGNCSNLEMSYMGGAYAKNISGIYYLTTNAHRPYYKDLSPISHDIIS